MKLADNRGQVLLLVTLVLSATIVTAGIVGGFLTSSQLRQARGSTDSAKAIYAADSGVEYELYNQFVASGNPYSKPVMGNGAEFTTTVSSGRIKSRGRSGTVYRAFEVTY